MGLHGDKEFPSLMAEGIILLMLTGFVSRPMLLRRKTRRQMGMERKHEDHKNSQIHLKPSPQGEAKQEKEVWAGERKL